MTMLLLVVQQSFGQEQQQLLNKLDVTSFTEASKVVGVGQSGTCASSFAWPGHHSMIIVAMGEQKADMVMKRSQAFRDDLGPPAGGNQNPDAHVCAVL